MQPGGMVFISVKREHSLQIGLDSPPDGTTSLLAKKESTLNAVLQYHGIAYHWKTLTDALGRALATDWTNASNLAGIPGSGEAALQSPLLQEAAKMILARNKAYRLSLAKKQPQD